MVKWLCCWIVLHEWLYSGGETQKHKGWWRSCFAMSRINRVYWTKGPGGVQWPYRIYLSWNRQQSVWYGENIIVGVIYRPPGTDINQFNSITCDILSQISRENKICYLMGDYNINILNNEVHSQTSDFIDLMYSYSLVPLINRPSGITNNPATLIDNIFSNNLHDLHKSTQAILVTHISDHLPIIHINWNFKDCNEELSIIRRSNTKKNREEFKQAMNNMNWTELYSMSDTQSAFS